MHHYDLQNLRSWVARIFEAVNVPPDHAAEAAAILVRCDVRGYRTHGLTRVASYVERLRAGDFNARPNLVHQGRPGGIVLDADGAMGQVALPHAVQLGQQALDAGAASVFVAIRSCGHLGALGLYALMAAESGVFCMLAQRTPPLLALPGFDHAAIGHNPIAFGCPASAADPIVFDVACSVAARGHILLAEREGREIPDGWALDETGMPTRDAKRALKGALLPMGGYKGIGIAMMVECLAGALTADAGSFDGDRNTIREGGAVGRQGAFLWMVNPHAFAAPEDFARYMAQWTGDYLSAGGAQAHIPGARGAELERLAATAGLELSASVESELQRLGGQFGLPFSA
ncbi:MAG: Ldh family oxidoreductase [Pseudolabrys sp.]|nr:Ldh family oxidoreductase [Pseudolabrys sp.]